jgi:glycosyltransferase involved in cell wall biosynthesis
MQKDPRINLYQNKETKGTLYSKSLGVKYSKGKYVLVSDQDDLYTQEDAFSTMYYYLEKDNLDILGFAAIYFLELLQKIES